MSQYEPTFTGDKAAITIRQAFSHTSGLGSSDSIADGSVTLQQSAAQIGTSTPLLYGPPGTQFSYGGTSMQAAGAAAEVAAGQSWDSLFAQRIATPLHLTQTHYALSGPDNPRIAGGIETNAAEFGRYMDMLLNHGVDRATGTRVLSAASVATMLTRQTAANVTLVNSPLPGVTDYGVGIRLDQREPSTNALTGALAGGARGFCAWLDLDDDYVGVISTDLTTFGNIRDLQYMMRDAAQAAFRAPALVGDTNHDNVVDFADLLTLAQHYSRASGQRWADGDFTGDGAVGFGDLLALSQHYNASTLDADGVSLSGLSPSFLSDWSLAQSLAPEPAGALAAAALAPIFARRRQRELSTSAATRDGRRAVSERVASVSAGSDAP